MKRSLFVIIGLTFAILLMANPVTKEAALQKARQFLSEKQGDVAASRSMRPVELNMAEGLSDVLYVFNVGQRDGYVIISGDDRVDDVLGYADKGEINAADMPANMKNWLQGYADQISYMVEHNIDNDEVAAARSNAKATKKPISPMLTCLWNQSSPFNDNCPDVGYDDGHSYTIERSAAGCLATAAAQVMYWHQKKYGEATGIWQTTTRPIPQYISDAFDLIKWTDDAHTDYSITNIVEAKAPTTIDWSKLVDIYPANAESNAEIAKLMEYVGAGLMMQYGPESSAMFSKFAPMLVNYFGYNKTARYVERKYYSYADWVDLMYEQLTNVGPLFFGGQSTGGGHAFVIDGYEQEDYFHVNWGWGGQSNGFFKLSVLYSKQQGIGGSKSQDGFNFLQNVTINVNPDNSIKDLSFYRLRVYGAWPNVSKVSRSSATDNFSPVALHCAVYNVTGETTAFDLGWGLYKEGELIGILGKAATNDVENYSGWNDCYFTISFGAGIEDGTYRIIPISRLRDTDTWYKDFNSERYYISAVISGNTMTLEEMGNTSLTATIEAVDALEAEKPATVVATVKNHAGLYSADLILTNRPNGFTDDDGEVPLCAQQVDIDKDGEMTVSFSFTPKQEGDMFLILYDRDENILAQTQVSVAPPTITTGNLTVDYTKDYTLKNGSFYDGFYGTSLSGTVKVTNTAKVDHTSGVIIRLYEISGSSTGFFDEVVSYETIPANGYKLIPFEYHNLVPGNSYYFNVLYKQSGAFIQYSYYLKCNAGVITYLADGTVNVVQPKTSVKLTDDVVALDISQVSKVSLVQPNSNPNTLYIVGNRIPSGLTGKNVIKNGVAEKLTLYDGYDFFAPKSFVATSATYTRQFTTGVDGASGWSTIVLPFSVAAVKQDGNDIDWFRSSSDTGKAFWLKSFACEDGTTMCFEDADQLEAGMPYLVGVPGAAWGADKDLTNKDITFCAAENATVHASGNSVVTGYSYKLFGIENYKAVTDRYVLNDAGSSFDKTTTTVAPFRAYFVPLNEQAAEAESLFIGPEKDLPSGITELPCVENDETGVVYNLKGMRVARPVKGLYIRNGKKFVVK